MPGEEWAEGFAAAIQMHGHGWDRMFDDRRADQVVMPILALCGDLPDEIRAELTAEKRQGILDQLPATLQMIAAFWRQPDLGFRAESRPDPAKLAATSPAPADRAGNSRSAAARRHRRRSIDGLVVAEAPYAPGIRSSPKSRPPSSVSRHLFLARFIRH
jgi:hypothetical protein